MALSLPDDVLVEIFVRVAEAASLFRCATACKQWLNLFADLSFLRQIWPDQHAFSLLGFIAKDRRHGLVSGVNGLVIPALRSPLGPGCRALQSFMPAAYGRLFDGAVLLASRRGLLLMRLRSTLGDSDRTLVHMAVCDLLASTCHLLPPLKLPSAYDDHEWCGYAILTDADCHGGSSDDEQPAPARSHSPFFRVVIIGSDDDYTRGYSLYTFSSLEVSWRTHIRCLVVGGTTRRTFSDATVRRGIAHWLRSGIYLITLNIQTGHLSCTELHALLVPLNYRHPHPCLTTLTTDESLALLCKHISGPRLEILVRQQDADGNAEWLCTRTIKLEQAGDRETLERGWRILGEKCGIILVNNHQHLFTVQHDTGAMEEVVGWPGRCRINPWESLPLEMDWPSFFVSRLGTGTQTSGRKGRRKSADHNKLS